MKEISFAQMADRLRAVTRTQWLIPERLLEIRFGPDTARERLWLDSGTHGQECAGPLALLEFGEEHQARWEPGYSWPWPHVQLRAVVVDSAAFDELGYGFIGVDGQQACWPPLWRYGKDDGRYWTYYDNNSTWMRTATAGVPDWHKILRAGVIAYRPTFVLSMHETVTNEELDRRNPYWPGSGMVVIETYPVSPEDYEAVIGIPDPLEDGAAFLWYLVRRWWGLLTGTPRWHRNARILQDNYGWQLCGRMTARFEELGGVLMRKEWQRYQDLTGALMVGRGRMIHSPDLLRAEWELATSWAVRRFPDCVGLTTESMPPGAIGLSGLDERVAQSRLFIQAALDTLEGGQ